MKSKKLPTWLKWGLKSCFLLLIILLSDYLMTCDFGLHHEEFCGTGTAVVLFPVLKLFSPFHLTFKIYLLISLVFYFLGGALISLAIEKISHWFKSQKKQNKLKYLFLILNKIQIYRFVILFGLILILFLFIFYFKKAIN